MKALIIDDEPPVITVVRLLVEWEKHGISEVFSAASAAEGMQVIEEERPEIILSDINLPDMNGLDLIEELQTKDPGAKIIIISAFDKFSYAQKAVQLGCVEYLLKPVQREKVNQAVEKAVRKYQEDSELQSDSRMTRAQSLLSLYLSSGQPPELMERIMELAPWIREWRHVTAGIISMGYLPDEDASLYTIQEEANRFVSGKKTGIASVWGSSSDIILLMDGDSIGLESQCRIFLRQVEEKHGLKLCMGLSAVLPFPEGIGSAHRMAWEAAVSANLIRDTGKVVRESRKLDPLCSYEWISNSLFGRFPDTSRDQIRRAAEQLARQIAASGQISIRQMENFRAAYNGVRNQRVMNCMREQGETSLTFPPLKKSFCRADGSFDGNHFADVICEDIISQQERCLYSAHAISMTEICYRAERYLEEHFSEEISMEEMAKHFGISSSHLSRSFKKEVGVGMNEYLTAVRIRRATELLREGRRPSEVSDAVGFQDPKYFSRVFRRETGTTPSEYRRDMMNGGADA